jgi:hypothetical protein
VACWLALAAVTAYAVDAIGFGVQPWAAAPIALALTGVIALFVPRRHDPAAPDLLSWLAIVVLVAASLFRLSWPTLVPPGRGPDLTHHLLLVDYIEQTGHLVHDRALAGALGEMAAYTPGSHLLAVMSGAWVGADGMRAFFPLVSLSAALTAGFVFLIARRRSLPMPYAIAAVLLLYLPSPYFFGGFTHDSYFAQTVATLFAVAMWWALEVWDSEPSAAAAALIAVFLAGVFLSWPIWLGPPLLVFIAFLLRTDLPRRDRLRHFAIVVGPLAVVGIVHAAGRWGWVRMVSTSGAVLQPSLESLGWLFPLLAMAGVLLAARDRRSRVTIALLLAIALQAVTLFVIAQSQGADTAYMALKMVYLAIYPMAIVAALALAAVARPRAAAGWVLAAVLMAVAARPALVAARPTPAIDLDFYAAGKWVRANAGASCVDYLVGDADTAYWLHLAVLGNPRAAERMAELDRWAPRAAVAPWITGDGRAYAIADRRVLPDEVRSRVAVVREFGHATVIAKPGAVPCR